MHFSLTKKVFLLRIQEKGQTKSQFNEKSNRIWYGYAQRLEGGFALIRFRYDALASDEIFK